MRDRIDLLFAATLCLTLLVGTCAVAYYGPAVNKEVTMALIVQWGVVAKLVHEGRKQ